MQNPVTTPFCSYLRRKWTMADQKLVGVLLVDKINQSVIPEDGACITLQLIN